MTNHRPDLTHFEKAILRLEEGLAAYHANPSHALIRDGLIQRFEFTYELSHKILKRYLEFVSPTPGQYDQMAFQDLIRSAYEQGLLRGTWPDWKKYREMRAKTSHTYEEAVAIEVAEGAARFLEEARYLRDRLRERLQ